MKATLCDKCKSVLNEDKGDAPGSLPQKTVIVDGLKFTIVAHAEFEVKSDICKKCFEVSLPKALSLFSGAIQPFEGKDHYKIDEYRQPICPHCQTTTNAAYLNIPNLKCWRCTKPMEVNFTNEKR